MQIQERQLITGGGAGVNSYTRIIQRTVHTYIYMFYFSFYIFTNQRTNAADVY